MVMRSFTVTIPVQINEKGKNIWDGIDDFTEALDRILKLTGSTPGFKWKRVGEEANNDIVITKLEAFERNYNLDQFQSNFANEVFNTVYDCKKPKIVHYILTKDNNSVHSSGSNEKSGTGTEDVSENAHNGEAERRQFELKADQEGRITICLNKTDTAADTEQKKTLVPLRKIHLVATVFGCCLIFLETERVPADPENMINEQCDWNIADICKQLGITGEKDMKVEYPTHCHVYFSSLLWDENCGINEKTVFSRMSISKKCPFKEDMLQDEISADISKFFPITHECFWICVLQKTVAMKISSWAGNDNFNAKDFEQIYEAYIQFDNQFNFPEISFKPEIQSQYEKIRRKMGIENCIDKVKGQINARYSIQENKTNNRRNKILQIITILSLTTGGMQVAEGFSSTPKTWVNIVVGVLMFLIGILVVGIAEKNN